MTSISQFEENRADNIISINERVDSHREQFRRTVAGLFADLENRNAEILTHMLLEAYEQDSVEMGNEASGKYWENVGSLMVLSFRELHTIPIADRGRIFNDARAMQLLWVEDQSYIETLAKDDMITGLEQGQAVKREVKTMTPDEIEQARTGLDIKGAVKRRGKKT